MRKEREGEREIGHGGASPERTPAWRATWPDLKGGCQDPESMPH